MSLILPSTAAPAPFANPGVNAATRNDEQAQNNTGSFGEALARSMEPATEKADKPAAKAATAQPARRQSANPKTNAEDLANAMALSFVPIESRMPQAALPVGTGIAADSVAPGAGAAALLASPGNTAPGAGAAALLASRNTAPGAGTAALLESPGNTAPGAGAAALLTGPDSAVPVATTALLNDLAAVTSPPAGGSSNAAGVTTGTDAQPRLAPILAAVSQKISGQTPLQASPAGVSDGAAIQLDPSAIAGQAGKPGTGLPEQSSKRDDKDANKLSEPGAARADFTPPAPHSTPKLAASTTAAGKETAALPAVSSHIAADAAVNTSTALPMPAAVAAMQAPVGLAASNAPTPTSSASLTPEVGSNEWGKALGQHVIQMGNAGHQVAELQLNPPGLGPLKVTLSMSDNQMQAMFVSAHSSVRAAVEAALPQLRTTLADSGISLGNTSVGAESQPQTAFANNQNGQPERGSYRRSEITETAAVLPARAAAEPVRRSSGMSIDTYA